jgi:trigger factor
MTETEKQYTADTTEDDGDVVVTVEVPQDTLESYKPQALDNLKESVSIDGFREGEIPEEVLENHVGEMNILQETAQIAIQDLYPEIIKEKEIQAIGRPDVKITKLSPGNPLEFEARTTSMPEVELPDDYKAVAAEAAEEADTEPDPVTDDDVEAAIDNIRRQWAQAELMSQTNADDPSEVEASPEDLPELNDEFVQEISEQDTVADFKAEIEKNIKEQNQREAEEKNRGQILDAVVDQSSATLPDLVVDGELDKMMAQFQSDVERAGMDLDEYFEQADTTKEEMREKWRPDAKNRAKTQLVLNKIAAEEDIQADDETVEEEVAELMDNYDDVPEARADTFVRSRLINQKAIDFLVSQGDGE